MKLRLLLILGAVAAGLALVLILTSRREAPEERAERPIMWSFDLRDLQRVEIALPREGLAEAWFQTGHVWYFDRPGRPLVDLDRWGGGVPYLLSGPGANRLLTDAARTEDLEIFGLLDPRMTIHLEHGGEHGEGGPGTVDLVIGSETPDTFSFYIHQPGSGRVYTVDRSWYEIMERLVVEPPYVEP